MKRYWVLLLVLLFGSGISMAQMYYSRSEAMHYFGVSASGGYSQIFTNHGDVTSIGSGGAFLGLNYEFHYGSFWISTGVEGQFMQARERMNDYPSFAYTAEDVLGGRFEMTYRVSKLAETQNIVFLNVPILLGYYHSSGFYAGAGIKVGYAVFSQVNSSISYTTSADYGRYVETFDDMPNHQLDTYTNSAKNKLDMLVRTSACLEIGWDVFANASNYSKSFCRGLKIGAWVETSLYTPFARTGYQSFKIEPEKEQAQVLRFHSNLCNTLSAQGYAAIPFYAGIKLTMLFRFSTRNSHCNCNH